MAPAHAWKAGNARAPEVISTAWPTSGLCSCHSSMSSPDSRARMCSCSVSPLDMRRRLPSRYTAHAWQDSVRANHVSGH